MTEFVERVVPEGRPEIPEAAQVMLSMRGRELAWAADPAVLPIDKGLLALLAHAPKGRWVPVAGIVSAVEEHQVEVLASVSRMFSVGLVDVEGLTTRRS